MSEQFQRLEYALAQTQRFGELVGDDGEISEAIENAGSWAVIAYNKVVEGDVPALTAALSITAMINAFLMSKVMALPDLPGEGD